MMETREVTSTKKATRVLAVAICQLSTFLVLAFLLSLCSVLSSCSREPAQNHAVRFVALIHRPAAGQPVFLTGCDSSLGDWNPQAILMDRNSDSVWSKTIPLRRGEEVEYNVTAGSMWTQALDSEEHVYSNFRLTVEGDTSVVVEVFNWLNHMRDGIPVLTAERFHARRQPLFLGDLWRYHAGDDTLWAAVSFNDSGWPVADPSIQWQDSSKLRWEGRGWFRFHMYVDSSLWNRTLAIRIEETGASQIYYNGRLLYGFGDVGASGGTYRSNNMSWWQEMQIDPRPEQLIAVRYANPDWREIQRIGYNPGFLISIKDLNTAFRTAVGNRQNAERQIAFTLIPLILALVHLSLYGFLRSQRQNLYYALCMLGFAGLTYFSYERNLIVDVPRILLLTKLGSISVVVAIFFGLMTAFALNYDRMPRRVWAYLTCAIVLTSLSLSGFSTRLILSLYYVFFGLTALEGILSGFKTRTRRHGGGWLLIAGFLALDVFIFLQALVDYAIVQPTTATSQAYVYGMMSLAISMSLFLSYDFARVSRDLQAQLFAVRTLSDKALEQERKANALALERKMIEIESERKSAELESARALQVSLLPKDVPHLAGLEIAAIMKTASEVGGDYYDFFTDDGSLTIAVGDATGHGLKAGNMVTATKGLLNMLVGLDHVDEIIISANQAIKRMNLPMMAMCLAVARLRGNTLWYSSAGMPPLLHYHASEETCEQVVLKAMPLGAVERFPYQRTSLSLLSGDVVVMTSDGLFEIFNEERNIYGMDNVMRSLAAHGRRSAESIAQGLLDDGIAWKGKAPLEDDLTIVVAKVTA